MIKITLEFTEDDVQEILDAANWTDKDSRQADELSRKEIKALKDELQICAPQFVCELVDGSRDACANDWLQGWGPDEREGL